MLKYLIKIHKVDDVRIPNHEMFKISKYDDYQNLEEFVQNKFFNLLWLIWYIITKNNLKFIFLLFFFIKILMF